MHLLRLMPAPFSSFYSNLDLLLAHLPLVRDGDAAAIHDARVATRRLRAALPVLAGPDAGEPWPAAARLLRALGTALGTARDVDVSLEVLAEIEGRAPTAAPAAAALRARLLPDQLRRKRELIKRLERLDLQSLEELRLPRLRRALMADAPSFAPRIAAVVAERAGKLQRSIERATGVYFPKRAHRVRVAIKKLRYAVELVDEREVPPRVLRNLRMAQESLGQLHDREVLMGQLMEHSMEADTAADRELARLLEAESRVLFDRYRAARATLVEHAGQLMRWAAAAAAQRPRRTLRQLGAVALPSAAVVLLAGRLRRAS